jgi:hypothetical protein
MRQLTTRIILILGVSIAAFGISLLLDVLLAPLPPILQFLIQVPAIVLLIEESRRYALTHEETLGLDTHDINGAFFLAAPLAAFAALTLFADIRKVIKPHARV